MTSCSFRHIILNISIFGICKLDTGCLLSKHALNLRCFIWRVKYWNYWKRCRIIKFACFHLIVSKHHLNTTYFCSWIRSIDTLHFILSKYSYAHSIKYEYKCDLNFNKWSVLSNIYSLNYFIEQFCDSIFFD